MSTFVYAYVTKKKKKTVLKLITEILTITEIMTQTYIWFVP